MTTRPVLLVDGPRAGHTLYFHSEPPTLRDWTPITDDELPRPIDYTLRYLTVLGRRIGIGWCTPGRLPSDEVLARLLLSEAAQEASR